MRAPWKPDGPVACTPRPVDREQKAVCPSCGTPAPGRVPGNATAPARPRALWAWFVGLPLGILCLSLAGWIGYIVYQDFRAEQRIEEAKREERRVQYERERDDAERQAALERERLREEHDARLAREAREAAERQERERLAEERRAAEARAEARRLAEEKEAAARIETERKENEARLARERRQRELDRQEEEAMRRRKELAAVGLKKDPTEDQAAVIAHIAGLDLGRKFRELKQAAQRPRFLASRDPRAGAAPPAGAAPDAPEVEYLRWYSPLKASRPGAGGRERIPGLLYRVQVRYPVVSLDPTLGTLLTRQVKRSVYAFVTEHHTVAGSQVAADGWSAVKICKLEAKPTED